MPLQKYISFNIKRSQNECKTGLLSIEKRFLQIFNQEWSWLAWDHRWDKASACPASNCRWCSRSPRPRGNPPVYMINLVYFLCWRHWKRYERSLAFFSLSMLTRLFCSTSTSPSDPDSSIPSSTNWNRNFCVIAGLLQANLPNNKY